MFHPERRARHPRWAVADRLANWCAFFLLLGCVVQGVRWLLAGG